MQPAYLVLDEPTSMLDEIGKQEDIGPCITCIRKQVLLLY